MKRLAACLVILACCGLFGTKGSAARAADSPATATGPARAPAARITLSTPADEKGHKQLMATVTVGGKPVANAVVAFAVRRTFGEMPLGGDTTLDDGTAAIAFPSDLPGGSTGVLQLSATITAPPPLAGTRVDLAMPGGKVVAIAEPFPRALWAPQAPVGLIVTIMLLVGGAWGAYAFVVLQLVAIRKGAKG